MFMVPSMFKKYLPKYINLLHARYIMYMTKTPKPVSEMPKHVTQTL